MENGSSITKGLQLKRPHAERTLKVDFIAFFSNKHHLVKLSASLHAALSTSIINVNHRHRQLNQTNISISIVKKVPNPERHSRQTFLPEMPLDKLSLSFHFISI